MTSPADIAIANQALGACRARTQLITSFTQGGPEASQINLNYASTRDALLRGFYWNFAKTTVALGNPIKTYNSTLTTWDTTQPPPPWYYEYTMPANCLKVRALFGQPMPGVSVPIVPNAGGDIGPALSLYKFEIVNDGGVQVIVTNAPSALAVITLGGLDPAVWDIEFQNAFVALLASTICMPLSGDAGLAKKLEADAQYWISEAKVQAANEGVDIQDIMPSWLRARSANIYDPGISIGGSVVGGSDC